MLPRIELIISGNTSGGTSGGTVDLYGNEPINLTYNIADIMEFGKGKSNFSQEFAVPSTPNNDALFSNIFEIGIDMRFDPRKKANAFLLCDSFQIITGYIQMTEISVSNRQNIIYNITLYGESCDLFNSLEGLYLTDLDYSDLDHKYCVDAMQNSWSGTSDSPGYYYPLINYGVTRLNNYGQPGVIGGPGATALELISVPEEMFPAAYSKQYFDRSFSLLGKTYNSTVLNSSAFKQTIIPFNSDGENINDSNFVDSLSFLAGWGSGSTVIKLGQFAQTTSGLQNQLVYRISMGNMDTTTAPFFANYYTPNNAASPPPGSFPSLDTYNIPTYAVEQFVCQIRMATTASWQGLWGASTFTANANFWRRNTNSPPYNLIPSTGPVSLPVNGTAGQSWAFNTVKLNIPTVGAGSNGNAQPVDKNEYHMAEVELILTFQNAAAAAAILSSGAASVVVEVFKYELNGDPATYWANTVYPNACTGRLVINDGQDIPFSSWVPKKIPITDYMSSIFKLYNLVIEPNKEKQNEYIVDSRENYFSSGVTLDWTALLDTSQPITETLVPNQTKKYIFTNQPDSDYWNDLYQGQHNEVYGTETYDVDGDLFDNVETIDTIFSSTLLDGPKENNCLMPQIFTVDPVNGYQRTDSNIRFLQKPTGLVHLPSGYVWGMIKGSTPAYVYNGYPYAGHLDNPLTGTTDVNFGLVNYVPYKLASITDNNMFNRYWKSYVDNTVDKNSKIVTAYFKLTPADIYSFRFNNIIFADGLTCDGGHYFWVNNIEYSPTSTAPSKVELFLLQNFVTYSPRINIFHGGGGGGGGVGSGNSNRFGGVNSGGNNYSQGVNNIIGENNIAMSENNVINGTGNYIQGANSSIVGDDNSISFSSDGSAIVGSSNVISGGTNNIVFGDSNNVVN